MAITINVLMIINDIIMNLMKTLTAIIPVAMMNRITMMTIIIKVTVVQVELISTSVKQTGKTLMTVNTYMTTNYLTLPLSFLFRMLHFFVFIYVSSLSIPS